MDTQLIKQIASITKEAVDAGLQQGKTYKDAVADSLVEAADKIRSGKLQVDDAVARASVDQAAIESARDRYKD